MKILATLERIAVCLVVAVLVVFSILMFALVPP